MKIQSAEFVLSAAKTSQFPQTNFPEIAFCGKSNVGKSTLINSLLRRKSLVKTSSVPGKTQLINFFCINQSFHLVDLPGYGFARVPVHVRQSWKVLIESYLKERQALKAAVLIVDSRHGATPQDLALYEWFQHEAKPVIVIANKIDKLKSSQIKKQLQSIQTAFALTSEPLPHSSSKKIGQPQIWQALQEHLQSSPLKDTTP